MKQTAVEWLYDNLLFVPISRQDVKYNERKFEQAKEMEKQFLKQAFEDSRKANIFEENKPPLYKDFEEWFNQLKGK